MIMKSTTKKERLFPYMSVCLRVTAEFQLEFPCLTSHRSASNKTALMDTLLPNLVLAAWTHASVCVNRSR